MSWLNIQVSLEPTLESLLTVTLAAVSSKLDANAAALARMEQMIMAKLDDILADVEAEKTTIAGLSTFIQGLKDQITNAGLSPADQAKVDAIFADTEANKSALASALTANTPAAPGAPTGGG